MPRAASDSPRRLARAPEQALLPQHPRRVQTFNNDPAVGFSQPCGQDVQVMGADIIDPAMQPGNLGGAFTVAP